MREKRNILEQVVMCGDKLTLHVPMVKIGGRIIDQDHQSSIITFEEMFL